MRVVSLRFLVGFLVALFAAAGPLAAQETLQGTWALDVKASQNVPEAQKGVDLKIAIRGDQLTIARFAGEVAVGEPMVLTLDGAGRQQMVGGQRATMSAKWLVRDKKFEQTVTMPQPGSVFIVVQTNVTELSPNGATMTRDYTTRRAKDREERRLVYRRK